METFKTVVTIVLCVSAIISAFCWAKSAAAKVPAKFPGSRLVWKDEDGSQTDLVETAKKQGKWNKIAAIFASIAAVAQAILPLL